ncbi:unnamed protein product [Urochloa humidicola]
MRRPPAGGRSIPGAEVDPSLRGANSLVEEGYPPPVPLPRRARRARPAACAASSVSGERGSRGAARRIELAMPRRRAAGPVTDAEEEEPGRRGPRCLHRLGLAASGDASF